MDNAKAIASAEMLAALRAAATREQSLAEPCRDPFARVFVGSDLRRIADFNPHFLLKHVLRMRAPGSYPFAIARTRHFDELLVEELRSGTEQVVILGAGYDSRACRFATELAQAKVFELDHPATQARKRQMLAKEDVRWPTNVEFVPIDFAREDLAETLQAAGFDRRRRTIFLWEGVSYYLPEAAVSGVLAFVASCPAGSTIAFDYAIRSFVDGDHSTYGGKHVARWLEEIGEPFLFGIDNGHMAAFLQARGLTLASDFGPEQVEGLYLRTKRGRSLGPTLGHVRMALARVPSVN